MKRLYVYFISIGILAGAVFSGCRQEPVDEISPADGKDLWPVLIKDSLFLELGGMLDKRKSLEELEIFVKDMPVEAVGSEVEQYLYAQHQAIRDKLAALRRRYSGFNDVYYAALWDSVNYVPLTRSTDYYLDEITVLGNCNLSMAVFQDILTSLETIKREHRKVNGYLSNRAFYAMFSRGIIVSLSETQMKAVKVITDPLGCGVVISGCDEITKLALEIRKSSGIYLVELRDILEEIMYKVLADPKRNLDGSFDGGGGSIGGGDHHPSHPQRNPIKELPESVQTVINNILEAFKKNGLDVSHVISRVYVNFKMLTNGNLAEIRVSAPPGEADFKDVPLFLTLPPYSRDDRFLLIVTHEFVHLALFDISRTAGNINELNKINMMLARSLDLNIGADPHHEYIGKIIDVYEQILRDAFPGKSEEFYRYGKWGGGIRDSYRFEMLPSADQKTILEYLKAHNLP